MSIASGTDSAYQQALLNLNTQNLDPSVVANTPQNIGAMYYVNPKDLGFRADIVGEPGDTTEVYRKSVAPNVDAVYDRGGNLLGFQGQNAYITDQSYVHGQWDTSGQANPVSTTKSSGGMLGSVGNTLLGLSLGYFGGSAIADALGGGLGDLSATDTSLGLAGQANAASNLGQVPNIGNLPTFGPAVQIADASGALPNLTPPPTTSFGQLGSGTYVPKSP